MNDLQGAPTTKSRVRREAFAEMLRNFLNGCPNQPIRLEQAANAVCDHHLLLTHGRLTCGCTTMILERTGRCLCQEHFIRIADVGELVNQITRLGRPSQTISSLLLA